MELKDATIALVALGQVARLSIFRLLVKAGPEGYMAGEIAEALSLPGATLSFHLKALAGAGLIQGESRARYICYRADFETMNGSVEFLTHNCCDGDRSRCLPAAYPSRKGARKTTRA